ncbi:MAG: lipid-A-disaccharide synthase [Simkaniaceae bacterium]|nr:lipid-A-disaccharide synthase [Simkaniaceae bacterium]
MKSCDLFIFAGELSGDLYGEQLIRELRALNPSLSIAGVAGPKMRQAGIDCLMPMEKFEIMGFIDVLTSLPRLFFLFRKVKKMICKSKAKAVLFIDYAEFNLKMAKTLRKKKISSKLIQFISPSVWAWRKNRIYTMEKALDCLLSILPFEKEYFAKTSLDVTYIGHPLKKKIDNFTCDNEWNKSLPSFQGKTILSIFPGSRSHELQKNFQKQLNVAKTIAREEKNVLIAISSASKTTYEMLKKYMDPNDPTIFLVRENYTYELMQSTDIAIATSGTVTLELALKSIPTVVTFAITKLDLFLAQKIFHINLPYYSLANIIGQQMIYPELFGPHFTEKNLHSALKKYFKSPSAKQDCINHCLNIKNLIGQKDATKVASMKILELI